MSGHSKFANIKHKKEKNDAANFECPHILYPSLYDSSYFHDTCRLP